MKSDDPITLEVTVVRVSRNATLFEHDGDEQWIPHSLIEGADLDYEDEDSVGEEGEITIPEWKAEDVGWW